MEHKKDRISELPDPPLQHVLSFVPIKQVVQSSTLSKRWKHVWFTIPVLEFDKTFFESKLWCKDNKKARKIQTRRVDQILLNRRRMGLSINKFTLFMPLTRPKSVSHVVDPWIDYVVKSDVEELNLDFYDDEWKRYLYPLPQSVLLAKSITMLMLTGCSLESLSLSCDIKINFSSLKKLSLLNMRTDDQIIQTLLAGCPVIEDMSIERCCGLKTIHFSGLSKLKFIELKLNDGLKKVKLEASNLCCLHIQEMTASKINMVHFKTLKMLKLSSRCITDNWLNCYISQLPLIEYLSLYGCQMLEKIKISSHSLKTLYLLLCKNLVEVQINDTPKLCELSYGGTSTISFSVNALPYLSEATYQMVSHSGPWDVQKIELLAKLSNSKLFNLRSIYSAKVFLLLFSFGICFLHIFVIFLHNLFKCLIFLCKGYCYTKGIERDTTIPII
jgi:hypothetical protein